MTRPILDIVRQCFTAYEKKDRSLIEPLLADDFTFTSPYDDHIDRVTYFKRCWPNSEKIESFHIEKLFDKGSEAFVRYELLLKTGGKFRNTEFFRVRDGKIVEVDVYFGRTTNEDGTQERNRS